MHSLRSTQPPPLSLSAWSPEAANAAGDLLEQPVGQGDPEGVGAFPCGTCPVQGGPEGLPGRRAVLAEAVGAELVDAQNAARATP